MRAIHACRVLALALGIGLAAIGSAVAQNRATNNPITYFYGDPKPERLVGFLDGYVKNPADWAAYPPLVGFFAVTFRRFPDWIDRLLPTRFDAKTAETVAAAFRLSGLPPMAQTLRSQLADAGQDPTLRAQLANLPTRLEELRIVTATHLDILWGAFFASGDPQYVRMILDFYARTADRSHETAIDITKLTVALTGGPKETFTEMRAKYDDATLRELIYAATAQWALISNGRQHPIVDTTVRTFIGEHKDSPAARGLAALNEKRN